MPAGKRKSISSKQFGFFYRWSYWPVEKCWAKVFILWKLLWWRETYRFQLTIVVGILIIINTRNACNAFYNSHSRGIIFTLTEHSNAALKYPQLTRLLGRRSKGKEDFGRVRWRETREEGGRRTSRPNFLTLAFRTPRSLSIIFLLWHMYNCCSVISYRLARKNWNIKNIFSRLLPTGQWPYYIENISSSGAVTSIKT